MKFENFFKYSLISVIIGLFVWLSVVGGIIYCLIHFIKKYW